MTYTAADRANSFVAFSRSPERVSDDDGNPITVRAAVLVREYPTIRVTEFSPKTHTNNSGQEFRTAYVKFSAESTGVPRLKNDFGASVGGDTETYDFLQKAHQAGAAIAVAIETQRRTRNDEGKISPLESIHALRGAKEDGSGGNANTTNSNCRNIIVGAGHENQAIVFNHEVASDVDEWPTLRNNRDGSLAPTGWRAYKGAITDSAAGGTGSLDQAGMDYIAAKVAALLASGTAAQSPAARPAQRAAHAVEGKPWDLYNSDGRVNAGSYLVGRYRAATTDAYEIIATAITEAGGEVPEEVDEDAESVTAAIRDALLWAADRAQVTVYGDGARPDRANRSHTEAGRWVHFTVTTTFPLTIEHITDLDARRDWIKQVAMEATRCMVQNVDAVSAYLNGGQPQATSGNQANAETEAGQGQDAEAQPTNRSTAEGTDTDAAAGAHEPTGQEPQQETTTPDRATLLQQYEALLVDVNLAAWPERVNPLLSARFGTFVIHEVDANALHEALTTWHADPDAFVSEAKAAYQAAQNTQPA